MHPLKFTSIQAPNADPVCVAISRIVARRLGTPVEFLSDASWHERRDRFDAGDVDVCWMCGSYYVSQFNASDPQVELVAAPVMRAPRYQNRPIYFSDVVIRADRPFQTFADLRGASWAYNEPGSHSGYNVTRWYLATRGYNRSFFGKVIGSGAHQNSLQMILAGEIDASAIDSTVLETELVRRPGLAAQIRVVEALGPSPIPPWVMRHTLPDDLKRAMRRAFAELHTEVDFHNIREVGQIDHFDLVDDKDYDPIREMMKVAQHIQL